MIFTGAAPCAVASVAAASEPAAATPAPIAPRNSRREVSLSTAIVSSPNVPGSCRLAYTVSLRLTENLYIPTRRVFDRRKLAAAGLAWFHLLLGMRLDPRHP